MKYLFLVLAVICGLFALTHFIQLIADVINWFTQMDKFRSAELNIIDFLFARLTYVLLWCVGAYVSWKRYRRQNG